MTLREYMDVEGLSVIEFAKQVGVTRQMVYKWLDGSWQPRTVHAIKIQEITGGKVTVEAW